MATVSIITSRGLREAMINLDIHLDDINKKNKMSDADMKKLLKLVEDIDYAWAHS